MPASDFALVQGMRTTRAVLVRWNLDPWSVVRAWVAGAAVVTAALLGSILLIASFATPDASGLLLPGLDQRTSMHAVWRIVGLNSLVLALHAFACVAGFIAGSSLPAEAERYSGFTRRIHDKAGPIAIAFVAGATIFSLATQAYALGSALSTLAAQNSMPPVLLLVGILPHAVPELIALFLPLAAWMIASRRGEWHELLAATFATTALAAPVLVVSALVEVYVSPHLIILLRG